MTMRKRDKHYISEIDLFLGELRQSIAESESQCKERKEYEHLNRLRDVAESEICPQHFKLRRGAGAAEQRSVPKST